MKSARASTGSACECIVHGSTHAVAWPEVEAEEETMLEVAATEVALEAAPETTHAAPAASGASAVDVVEDDDEDDDDDDDDDNDDDDDEDEDEDDCASF